MQGSTLSSNSNFVDQLRRRSRRTQWLEGITAAALCRGKAGCYVPGRCMKCTCELYEGQPCQNGQQQSFQGPGGQKIHRPWYIGRQCLYGYIEIGRSPCPRLSTRHTVGLNCTAITGFGPEIMATTSSHLLQVSSSAAPLPHNQTCTLHPASEKCPITAGG